MSLRRCQTKRGAIARARTHAVHTGDTRINMKLLFFFYTLYCVAGILFFLTTGNVSEAGLGLTLVPSCCRGRTTATRFNCVWSRWEETCPTVDGKRVWSSSRKPRIKDIPPDASSSDGSISVVFTPSGQPPPLQSHWMYQIHYAGPSGSLLSPLIAIRHGAELYCQHQLIVSFRLLTFDPVK